MDPNQNQTQNQNITGAPQAGANLPQAAPPLQNPEQNITGQKPAGGNKIILFVAIGIIALVLIASLFYLAIKYSTPKTSEVAPLSQQKTNPTQVQQQVQLIQEENNDLGNPEQDLKSIEQDTQKL